MKNYKLALFIFRRDLRLQDNTGLIAALKSTEKVLPCFIFDPDQIQNNDFKSAHCIQFMLRSIEDLGAQLQKKSGHLYLFAGKPEKIIKQLFKEFPIDSLHLNEDYTPYSLKRDQALKEICEANHVDFFSYQDALINHPREILKPNRTPYTVFTPYFNKAKQFAIAAPQNNNYKNFYKSPIPFEKPAILKKLQKNSNPNLAVKGGRQEAKLLIKKISNFENYKEERNFPSLAATTHLSAHNKFGTISVRELYAAISHHLGPSHTLIQELYWRDFFTQITFHFPHVLGLAFQKKYADIKWSQNHKKFNAWCTGTTGFPIVDAGMRELNETGYMHNRVRMIVASFLTKDLHIDWRAGEKYFAQLLVDYDPAVNNGNWQWAASTGCDAQPYFRVFNPWLQQKKYDKDALYIKKWVGELSAFDAKKIHDLSKIGRDRLGNYPLPIVDHSEESRKSKLMYKLLNS